MRLAVIGAGNVGGSLGALWIRPAYVEGQAYELMYWDALYEASI